MRKFLYFALIATMILGSSASIGALDLSFGKKKPAATESKSAVKAVQEGQDAYAARMIRTIQGYIDKGYVLEAKFLLDDLKKAPVPAGSKDAIGSLEANLTAAFGPDKEDSHFNSALLTKAKDVNGKYGYIDQTGAFVIEAKYDDAREFSEGLALVGIGRGDGMKQFYIDTTGKTVLSVELKPEMYFFDPEAKTVSSNGALVKYDGDTSALTSKLRLFAEGGFHNGLAHWNLLCMDSIRVSKDASGRGRSGAMYVDKTGKEVFILYSRDIPDELKLPQYVVADNADFHEGAVRVDDSSSFVYIDKTGKEFTGHDFNMARDFCEGLACIQYNNSDLWGYIDLAGKVAIKPFYNAPGFDFSDGVGVFVRDPKDWSKDGFFFDKVGNISYHFANKSTDSDHLDYIVNAYSCGDGMIPLIRSQGPRVAEVSSIEVFDPTGKLLYSITEPKENWHYNAMLPFADGRAFVKTGGFWGVIDTSGKLVVQFTDAWTPLGPYRNGLAVVKTTDTGRRAYLDRDGKIVFSE